MRLLLETGLACTLVACMDVGDLRSESYRRETPATRDPDTAGDPPPVVEQGHCENGSLSFGPVSLPDAVLGEPYEVAVRSYAEKGWGGEAYDPGSLPPGLAFEGEKGDFQPLVIRGVPTEAGAFSFQVTAVHGLTSNGCSTMPDPHTFDLVVHETAPDAGIDAQAD